MTSVGQLKVTGSKSLLCFVLFQLGVTAQESRPPAPKRELVHALDMAASRRFEFAADLMLSAFANDKTLVSVVGKEVSLDHLQRVMSRSHSAQRPNMWIPVPRRGGQDIFDISIATARLRMDGTSLQRSLIKLIHRIDPGLATKLLPNLPAFSIESRPSCRDTTVQVVEPRHFEELFHLFPDQGPRIIGSSMSAHHAAALASVMASGVVPKPIFADAMTRIGTSLSNSNVSDRVFATLELRLKLGQSIESLVNTAPPAERFALFDSYQRFVARHAAQERCSDVRMSTGEDMVLKFTIPRVLRIADKLGVSLPGFASRNPVYSKELPVELPSQMAPEVTKEFEAELALLKNSGSVQREDGVKQHLDHLMSSEQIKGCARCEWVLRIETNIAAIVRGGNAEVSRVAAGHILRLLSDGNVKEAEPGLWVYYLRYAMRLMTHPSKAVASNVERLFSGWSVPCTSSIDPSCASL